MATPWLDRPSAWIEGAAGFDSGDVAAAATVCRAQLAVQTATVGGAVACQAIRLGATVAQPAWQAEASGETARLTAACAAGIGVGWPHVAAGVGGARIASGCAAVSATVRGQAAPSAGRLALVAVDILTATGLREVARLFSPIVTGCRLVSPVTSAVSLASHVEIEQT